MKIAPVLLSVYNRPVHFKKCIESLKDNKFASETHLFVAIDAPYRKEDEVANRQVVDYAKTISGFKEVTLFIREENLGIVLNDSLAMADVFKQYDCLIRSEDDNVFSKDFLYFINKGLDVFNNREDIFSVCAYNFPIEKPLVNKGENIYINHFFSGWGFGVWKNKWEKINWNKEIILQKTRDFLKDYKSVYEYNKTANNLVLNLIYMIKKNTVYGDSYISLYQYLNKEYSLFPIISRVKNIGHDGSGAHCRNKKKNDIYNNQEIYQGDDILDFPVNIQENKKVNSLIGKYFKRNILKNFYTFILLILVNSGLLYKKN